MSRVAILAVVVSNFLLGSHAACPNDPDLDLRETLEVRGAGSTVTPFAAMFFMLGMSGKESARLPAVFLLAHYTWAKAVASDPSTWTKCGDVRDYYRSESCCGSPDKILPKNLVFKVTRKMVENAQEDWGNGIVNIADAKLNGKDFEKAAHDHIQDLYAYNEGPVLFKPTLAAEKQFRSTMEGALSYFVATNGNAPEDKGFAIKGWKKVRFENENIIVSGKTAMAMGNYYFTTPDGSEVKVEYTFGYMWDDDESKLRINLHHSSMPYEVVSGTVTKDMVMAAQEEWGDGIVNIASAKVNGQDFEKAAHDHIQKLYAYSQGSVLFKPTLAAEKQFRSTMDGALSYFVATNGNAQEDKGFAIKGWTKVRFVNEDIILSGSVALAMGNYYFTTPEGTEVKVEYSFGYVLDSQGQLRINLHHSSMPYAPVAVQSCGGGAVTRAMVTAAQKEWGDGIVKIAAAKVNGQDFEKAAHDHIQDLYAYGEGAVLFKPTLAAEMQFRSTLEGALSYFVATNGKAPEDKGFAIKGWTKVRFVNENIILSGNTAMAMGNYFFTTPEGTEVKVEYSFGYMLDSKGKLRITLHHSSMPYEVMPVHSCDGNLTKAKVEDAQKEWGLGIVRIATAHNLGLDYAQVADDLVKKLYAYDHGGVLFKPTLASQKQFRPTFAGALSYFVATNGAVSEDSGFAIKQWTNVRFENQEIMISGNTAMAMGNYYFRKPDNTEVKVEYSFGYKLDSAGDLRITLHHSSMPYSAR